MPTARSRIAAALRTMAFGLERIAAEEAASSAVRGASESLRDELDGAASELAAWGDRVAARATSAFEDSVRKPDGVAAEAARSVSRAAARGALDELERQWADGGLPLHGLVERVDHLLDDLDRIAEGWQRDRLDPAERARAAAVEVTRAAVAELRGALAEGSDGEALARTARTAGREFARGAVEGAIEGIREASRSPELREAVLSVVRGVAGADAVRVRRTWQDGVRATSTAATEGVWRALRMRLSRPAPVVVGTVLFLCLLRRR